MWVTYCPLLEESRIAGFVIFLYTMSTDVQNTCGRITGDFFQRVVLFCLGKNRYKQCHSNFKAFYQGLS